MAELSALNEQFALHDQLVFREGPGGLGICEITNGHAVASVALQGAQLLSWIPRGEQPVIWLSRDARFEVGRSMWRGAGMLALVRTPCNTAILSGTRICAYGSVAGL